MAPASAFADPAGWAAWAPDASKSAILGGIALPVSIVIPTWRRRDLLARVLDTLERQIERPARVIVVDNGSADGSAELARQRDCMVIELPENRGFAPAVNLGVRAAETEFVAILNNDVDCAPDWLVRLCAALQADEASWFACGKLLARDGLLDGAFDLVTRSGLAWRAGAGRADGGVWDEPRRIASAPMTAALFRRSLFEKVGYLDEDYGSYYEDVDFGLRCALAGCGGLYVPTARAIHDGNATLGGAWRAGTVKLLARNQALLARKHFTQPTKAVLWGQLLWGLLALKHGQWSAWRTGRREAEKFAWRQEPEHPRLVSVLEANERELAALQQETGQDTLWRVLRNI